MQPVANECILLLLYRIHLLSTLYIYALKPSLVLFPLSLFLFPSALIKGTSLSWSLSLSLSLYFPLSPSLFSHTSLLLFPVSTQKGCTPSSIFVFAKYVEPATRHVQNGQSQLCDLISIAEKQCFSAVGGAGDGRTDSDVSITLYVFTLNTLRRFTHRFHNFCPQHTHQATHIFHLHFCAQNMCVNRVYSEPPQEQIKPVVETRTSSGVLNLYMQSLCSAIPVLRML